MSTPYKPRPSYTPKPQWGEKAAIPGKEADDELINKLYLLVTDGNFLKLKDFMTNKINATVRNETDETVLHIIIKNDTLTDNEKYELVKLCINNGAMVNGYDKNNITPLHIACELQLAKVIDLLLENGADVNAHDSQNKTPIYNAITGKNITCPSYNDAKPKSLIKNKAPKKEQILNDLEKTLNVLIAQDPSVQINFDHLSVYMSDFSKIWPQQYKDFMENSNKIINDTLFDSTKSTSEKKRILYEKMTEKKRVQLVQPFERITNHKSIIEIQAGIENGWHLKDPSTNTKISIMKNFDKDMHFEKLKSDLARSEQAIKSNIVIINGEIIGKHKLLKRQNINRYGYIDKLYELIENDVNIQALPQIQLQQVQRELNNIFKIISHHSPLPSNPLHFDNKKYKNLITHGNLVQNIKDIYDYAEQFNQLRTNYLQKLQDEVQKLQPLLPNPAIQAQLNLLNQKIAQLQAESINVNQIIQTIQGAWVPWTGNSSNTIIQQQQLPAIKMYFIIEYDIYVDIFKDMYTALQKFMDIFYNNVIQKDFDAALNNDLPFIILLIINLMYLLVKIEQEFANIQNKISSILAYAKTKNLTDDTIDEINTLKKKLESNILNHPKMEELYSLFFRNYIDTINDILSFIRGHSTYEFLDTFHNKNALSSTNPVSDMNQLNNVVNYPVMNIQFPESESFQKFKEHIKSSDDDKNKEKLFEKFMIQANVEYNGATFYKSNLAATPSKNPTTGYIGDPMVHNLATTYGNLPLGNFGLAQGIKTTKSDNKIKYTVALPYRGDLHLGLIKFDIIADIVKQIYNHDPKTHSQPKLDAVKKQVEKFENLLPDEIDENKKKEIIYASIAKIIENYISRYIDHLVLLSVNKTVKKISQSLPDEFYWNLIKDQDRKLIASQVEGYKLGLDNLYKQVFTTSVHDIGKSELSLIVPDKLTQPLPDKNIDNICRIKNAKYSEYKSSTETCYIINSDIAKKMLNPQSKHIKKPNLNNKDNLGQSPIFYAIDRKNTELVGLILTSGADIKHLTNKYGKTAVQYIIDDQLDLISDAYYNVCNRMTNDLFLDFQRANNNNLPVNTDIIFPMAIHMVNHHFLKLAQDYHGNWSAESHQELINTTEMKFESIFPILDIQMTSKDIEENSLIHNKQQTSQNDIKETDKKLNSYKHTINNLASEKQMILKLKKEQLHIIKNKIKHTSSEYDDFRLDEIDHLITKYTNLITDETTKQQNYNNDLGALNKVPVKTFNLSIDKVKPTGETLSKLYDTVADLYESIFVKIFNENDSNLVQNKKYKYKYDTDYKSYQNLWKLYIDKQKNKEQNNYYDHTLFIENLGIYQHKIFNDKTIKYNKLRNKIYPVHILYQNLFIPYINNYFELPQEYNSLINNGLNVVIDIIMHITKRVTLANMYYIIVSNILENIHAAFRYKGDTPSNSEYSQMVGDYLKNIIGDQKTKTSQLANYIFNEMAEKLVKKILDIYEEDDIDKDNIEIDKLFSHIIDLMTLDTTLPVKQDSVMIKNLKDVIFPYYQQYITTSVNELKTLIDNYLRFIYTQGKNLEIIHTLLTQFP
jgi:ankyrin repeat protein